MASSFFHSSEPNPISPVHSSRVAKPAVSRRWNKDRPSKAIFPSLSRPQLQSNDSDFPNRFLGHSIRHSNNPPINAPSPDERSTTLHHQHEGVSIDTHHSSPSFSFSDPFSQSRQLTSDANIPPPLPQMNTDEQSGPSKSRPSAPTQDVSGFLSRITEWKEGLDFQIEVNATLQAELNDLTLKYSSQSNYVHSLESEKAESLSSLRSKESTLRSTLESLSRYKDDFESLQVQHADVSSQLQESETRAEEIKSKLKHKIASISNNVGTSEANLALLKTEHDEFKSAMLSVSRDVQGIRASSAHALKAVQVFLDNDGHSSRGREIQSVVSDLQESCNKSQQVNDLLREKLQLSGLQVIESKQRVCDLETFQKHSSDKLEQSSLILSQLQAKLDARVDNLVQSEKTAMLEAQEAFKQLSLAETKNAILGNSLEQMNGTLVAQQAATALEAARAVEATEKAARLDDLLTQSTSNLESARQRIEMFNVESHSTHNKLVMQEEQKSDLSNRFHKAEVQLEELLKDNNRLRGELGNVNGSKSQLETEMKEKLALIQNSKQGMATLTVQFENLQAQHRTVVNKHTNLKPQLMTLETQLRKKEQEYMVLQDRFDAQTLTLRLTKEQCGDIQERLTSAECSTATFKENLNNIQSEIHRREAEAVSTKAQIEQSHRILVEEISQLRSRLAQDFEAHNQAIHISEKRATAEEHRALLAESLAENLASQLKSIRHEMADLQNNFVTSHPKLDESQYQEMQGKVEDVTKELATSRVKIEHLESRASTLQQRYEQEDLSIVEREFLNTLVKTTMSIHEQEVVSKSNELHRKENFIGSLQARIIELETALARSIQDKKNPADTGSIVDLNMWLHSPLLGDPDAVLNEESLNPKDLDLGNSPSHQSAEVHPSTDPPASPLAKFGQLVASEESDLSEPEDKTTVKTTLGKRGRATSPAKSTQDTRPGRKKRTAVVRKTDPPVKSKARKR